MYAAVLIVDQGDLLWRIVREFIGGDWNFVRGVHAVVRAVFFAVRVFIRSVVNDVLLFLGFVVVVVVGIIVCVVI